MRAVGEEHEPAKEAWSEKLAGELGEYVMMEQKGEENVKMREISNSRTSGSHPFTHSTVVNRSYNLGVLIGARKRQFLPSRSSGNR